MKTHEEFEALLDAFVDGELSSEDMQAVEEHLNTCPDCRAYVDDALAIRAAFPTVEETPVPEGFADGVLTAIAAQSAPAKKQAQPWKKLLLPLAACIAIVVVQTIHPTSGSTPATEPRMAEEAAAPVEYALDTASEEDVLMEKAFEEDAPYFAHATLTAQEAGDLLDGFQPVDETEEARHYRLTAQEYDDLLAQLAERNVTPVLDEAVASASSDLALVTILE